MNVYTAISTRKSVRAFQDRDVPEEVVARLLEAARLAWIEKASTKEAKEERARSDFLEPKTEAGVVDFHALRHSFITNLARGGVHPKTAQDLARHSDINLTLGFYTHTLVSERAEALNVLPDYAEPVYRATDAG